MPGETGVAQAMAGRGDFTIFGVPSGFKIGWRSGRARACRTRRGTCGSCRRWGAWMIAIMRHHAPRRSRSGSSSWARACPASPAKAEAPDFAPVHFTLIFSIGIGAGLVSVVVRLTFYLTQRRKGAETHRRSAEFIPLRANACKPTLEHIRLGKRI